MHQCVLVLQWCIIKKSRFYKKYLKISLLTLNLALKFSYFLFCDDPLGCEIDNKFALYCGKKLFGPPLYVKIYFGLEGGIRLSSTIQLLLQIAKQIAIVLIVAGAAVDDSIGSRH